MENDDANQERIELPENMETILSLLFRYWCPYIDWQTENTALVRSLRKFSIHIGHWIPLPLPTAHQILEAQLQLREFLRDKVTPAELAELMGEY